MTNEQRARKLAEKLQDCVDVVRGDGGIERMIMDDRGIVLIAAAFVEVKSDTLNNAENAAFEALTRHGFTGARYCVIAAIRSLIDDPAEPAAPDPTKALARTFANGIKTGNAGYLFVRQLARDNGLLDGEPLWQEPPPLTDLGRAALRLAEDGG